MFPGLYIWTMSISRSHLFQTLQARQLNYFSQPGNNLLENHWWLRNYQKSSEKWKFKSLSVLLTAVTYLTSKKKSQIKSESISHQEIAFFFFPLIYSAKLMAYCEVIFKF